jgi:heptosyltransferase-2
MHIASALPVPVVAIFGPTHPKLGFAPVGSRNVVLCADVKCSPCSLHGEKRCGKRSRFCMDLIEPDMVIEAVERLLKEGKSISKGA